jgi:integrase/recombinase XerD
VSQDNGKALADLDALIGSWTTHLMAERKSPHTIRTYTDGVAAFTRWCNRNGVEQALDRPTVSKFTAALLADGAEAATALSRQGGVRRFSAWLAAEGEIPADELAGMSPPKLDSKVPHELTADQVRAMLATCGAKDFHDIRDAAIIRLMTESMVRSRRAHRDDDRRRRHPRWLGAGATREGRQGPRGAVRPADGAGA